MGADKKNDESEFSNEQMLDFGRQILEYLKIEAPKQRKHQLMNKGIDAVLVMLILIGTTYLGSQGILNGQMVAGLYGAALGYLFGVGRRE